MAQTLRHPQIIARARRDGKVTVDGLVSELGVTPQTIRRDLAELTKSGQLERVHGGAVLPSGTVNIAYAERRQLHQHAKQEIARAVAARIPNDCALCLNIGTTTEAVAQELLTHTGLLVVTNNMHIAMILAANDAIEVVVTGGVLRASDGGLVGAQAARSMSEFRFDIGVIGCSALGGTGDILDYDLREVDVSQRVLAQSDQVILAADASKFDRKAPARIASLAQVDLFVTDGTVPDECTATCRAAGTEIVVVGGSAPIDL